MTTAVTIVLTMTKHKLEFLLRRRQKFLFRTKNPFPDSRKTIADFINEFTSIFIDIDQVNEVILLATKIMQTGIKEMDASHLACAILADCDYFLTTDDRVLKFQSNKINVINPIEFLKVLEANEYVQHD